MLYLRAYATIWDFVNDIFGTNIISMPPNTYGLLLAIAFMVGIYFARQELKRRTDLGIFDKNSKEITIGKAPQISDLIVPFLFGFFVMLKLFGYIQEPEVFRMDPQSYILSIQGNKLMALLGGLAMAIYEYFKIKKAQKTPPVVQNIPYNVEDRIFDILLLAVVGGILGSKLMDAIDNPASMQELLTNPIQSLASGLSILGGLWLAALLIIIYGKKNKINLWALTDSLAPSFFIAYAVGRLGCQFSGDGCWGIPSAGFSKPAFVPDFLWGNTYAHNVNNEGIPMMDCSGMFCSVLPEPHFPTPLYEFIMVTILFLFIWKIRKSWTKYLGAITGLFMIFNGLERFLIEFIRENTKYTYFGFSLSQAQYISFFMMLIGAGIVVWKLNKYRIK
jgi:prolipoprotein diacylglyceryl transferase